MAALKNLFNPVNTLSALAVSTALTTSAAAESPWDKMRVTPPHGSEFFNNKSAPPSFDFQIKDRTGSFRLKVGPNGAFFKFNIPDLNIRVPSWNEADWQKSINIRDASIIQSEIIKACHPNTPREDATKLLPRCANKITEEMIAYTAAYGLQVEYEHAKNGLSFSKYKKSLELINTSIERMEEARNNSYPSLGHRIEAMAAAVVQTAEDLVTVDDYTGLRYRPEPWAVILNGAYHLSNNSEKRGYRFNFNPKDFYDVVDPLSKYRNVPVPVERDSDIDSNENFSEDAYNHSLPILPNSAYVRDNYKIAHPQNVKGNISSTCPGNEEEAQYGVQAVSCSNTLAIEMFALSERYSNYVTKHHNGTSIQFEANKIFDAIEASYSDIEESHYTNVGQRIENTAHRVVEWGEALIEVDQIIEAAGYPNPQFEGDQFIPIIDSARDILGRGRTRSSVIDTVPDIEHLKDIPIITKASNPAVTGIFAEQRFEYEV